MKTVDINSELYIPILTALNLEHDESGRLTMIYPQNRKVPASVGTRNLVLPTPELLKSLPDNAIVFHPMSENVARGDSAMQNYLKTLVTFKVTFGINYIAQRLYSIAADEKLHSKLTGDQLAILTILPEADAKGEAALARVLEAVDLSKVRTYNIFNKRSGRLKGEQFNRVAIATFPLLQDLLKPEGTLWGHRDIRKRDLKDFRALFDYIIPGWEIEDKYSAASDSMEAPSFHALMLAFNKIMEPLNRITEIYGDLFKDKNEEGDIDDMKPYVYADMSFISRFDNLSKYRNVIPVMSGNDGEPLAGSNETTELAKNPKSIAPAFTQQNLGADIRVPEPTPAPAPTDQYQTPQQAQPVYQQQQQPNQPVPQQPTPTQNQGTGLGFGNYSTQQAQRPQYPTYPPMGGMQQQQMQQQPNGAGVAGFGTYHSGNPPYNPNAWGQPMMNAPYPGQYPQQQQMQQQPATPFDSWNQTAQQLQQQQQVQQPQNPYTMPSTPQGYGITPNFQQPNMGMGQQQPYYGYPQQGHFGYPQQGNGQFAWGNQQQQMPPQQWGNPNQQQMTPPPAPNPYTMPAGQQQGGMFKVRR